MCLTKANEVLCFSFGLSVKYLIEFFKPALTIQEISNSRIIGDSKRVTVLVYGCVFVQNFEPFVNKITLRH